MLINVANEFQRLVYELALRVEIELQSNGWAVIIDKEVVTWCVCEQRAREMAIELIEAGV